MIRFHRKTLLWTALFLAATVFGVERTRLAVFSFQSREGVPASLAEAVREALLTEFVQRGRFDMVDRANIEAVLKEQALQNSGCTETECAVKLGNILNVQKSIVGAVSKVGETRLITANLIDLETTKIEASISVEFGDDEQVLGAAAYLARVFQAYSITTGKVVRAEADGTGYVDLGESLGVTNGRRMRVIRYEKPIMDQATGEVLARPSTPIGLLQVDRLINNKVSTFRMVSNAGKNVEEGDAVLLEEAATFVEPPPIILNGVRIVRAKPLPPSVQWKLGVTVGTGLATLSCLAIAGILQGQKDSAYLKYQYEANSDNSLAQGIALRSTIATIDGFYTAVESGLILTAAFGLWTVVDAIVVSSKKKATPALQPSALILPDPRGGFNAFVAVRHAW